VADGTGAGGALSAFLIGYLLILAMPGPNMLALGCVAALRGLGAALPLCLGLAAGAWALGGAMLLAALGAAAAAPGWTQAGRVAGATLLAMVALLILRGGLRRAGVEAARPGRRLTPLARIGGTGSAAGLFVAGFLTAMTNPLTGAFFAAQFLGPAGITLATAPSTLLAAAAAPLTVYLAVACVLSREAVRGAVLACGWPIRVAAAVALVAQAVAMVWPRG
jgi:threonine/homoserine/homoserine lactone efflux protein